jgi:uncharacterized membrane protein YfcA
LHGRRAVFTPDREPTAVAPISLSPSTVAVVVTVLFLGGVVAGVNGFGFAAVGTAALAGAFDPRTAVVVMLLPLLAANASLAAELRAGDLRACARRFWPYVLAAVVGAIAGMALLARIPTRPLTVGLGAFTLGYVAVSQRRLPVPGRSFVRRRCFGESTRAKLGLGVVSGALFGASNVGVQVVAYLRSRDFDRGTFVGVLASVFLGVTALRIGAAAWLGFYHGDAAALSVVGVVPGLLGVATGKRLRPAIPEATKRAAALALLTALGLKLTAGG